MAQPAVITVDAGPHKVSRRVAVSAPAADVFALVVDPHRHHELDGSGTLRDTTVRGPDALSTGDTFRVGMKQFGVPYVITSTVTEVVNDRVVEWKHPLGHRWRWELVETAPGTTEVTETFDYSTTSAPKVIELIGYDRKNAQGIAHTLVQLAKRFA